MTTVLSKWAKEELRSVIHFYWAYTIQPVEIHRVL